MLSDVCILHVQFPFKTIRLCVGEDAWIVFCVYVIFMHHTAGKEGLQQ